MRSRIALLALTVLGLAACSLSPSTTPPTTSSSPSSAPTTTLPRSYSPTGDETCDLLRTAAAGSPEAQVLAAQAMTAVEASEAASLLQAAAIADADALDRIAAQLPSSAADAVALLRERSAADRALKLSGSSVDELVDSFDAQLGGSFADELPTGSRFAECFADSEV